MPPGGKRAGAGRKKVIAEAVNPAPGKNLASLILDSLRYTDAEWRKRHRPYDDKPKDFRCLCEICVWRRDAQQADASGQSARRYLWDRRDGKPTHHVNHMHDKAIEHNVTISYFETIEAARKRASQAK